MYIYSDHAKKMMKTRKIIQEDVRLAIEHGDVEFMKINERVEEWNIIIP